VAWVRSCLLSLTMVLLRSLADHFKSCQSLFLIQFEILPRMRCSIDVYVEVQATVNLRKLQKHN